MMMISRIGKMSMKDFTNIARKRNAILLRALFFGFGELQND